VLYTHSHHRYFLDPRSIRYSTTSGSLFHSIICLGILSIDFTELLTLNIRLYFVLIGVLGRAFQGVTPSFHSLNYWFNLILMTEIRVAFHYSTGRTLFELMTTLKHEHLFGRVVNDFFDRQICFA